MGSGCGSVGRAVASNSRGPQFKSRHRQKNCIEHFTVNYIEKTKIVKMRPGRAHFKKNIFSRSVESNPVNLETRYTVIFCFSVSVL